MTSHQILESTKVTDVEKRLTPSKHYVYIIEVQYRDEKCYKIGRRFGSFFDMHMNLLEQFPIEGGLKDPNKRIIPYLPGKNLFSRNHSRESAYKRLHNIAEYCEALNKLPPKISQCNIVHEFFKPTTEDSSRYTKNISSHNVSAESNHYIPTISGPLYFDSYVAIAKYVAEDKTQIHLNVGESVEVVEQNENGWWLVTNAYGSSGWVPGAYLEKPGEKEDDLITERAKRGEGKNYTATYAYTSQSHDELSFPAGALIEVLEKNLEGWWLGSYKGEEGWVPATYLSTTKVSGNENKKSQTSEASSHKHPRIPPKRSTIRRQLKSNHAKIQKEKKTRCRTLYDFTATIEDGVSFKADQIAEVLDQTDSGWWLVTIEKKQGWAPASYLKFIDADSDSLSDLSKSVSKTDLSNTPKATNAAKKKETLKQAYSAVLKSDFKSSETWKTTQVDPGKVRTIQTKEKKESSSSLLFETPIEKENWFWNVSRQEAEAALINQNKDNDALQGPTASNVFCFQPNRINRVLLCTVDSSALMFIKESYFIIRPSSKRKPGVMYSLTLYHRKSIFHIHIRKRDDGMFATGNYSDGEKTFRTVSEMVEFHRNNTLVVGDLTNQVKLQNSPPRS